MTISLPPPLWLGLVNGLLATEPWARDLLRPHAGQVARLEVGGVSLHFAVSTEGNLLAPEAGYEPDVSISIAAGALPSLLHDRNSISGHARISGNAAFAETLQTLFQHLRPDLGAILSPLLGDVVANRIDGLVRGVGKALAGSLESMGNNASAALRENTLPLLRKETFASFKTEIEGIALRLEHLEKRMP